MINNTWTFVFSKMSVQPGEAQIIIVVDRSVEPEYGFLVVVALDGELTVQRWEVYFRHSCLMPDSDSYDPNVG